MPLRYGQFINSLGDFTDLWHLPKIQRRVHALAEHVHSNSNNIAIASAFTVAKQCTLDSFSARHQSQLSSGYAGTPVVVSVQRQHHRFTIWEVA